ncbi:uncharacterized protein K441DRAFT_71037 [Cenococcum geophilum 1.58]|uniref:uncharacterized protein n=1 Tax=Cenococcum geophilum 1.58 TaxID=794803 RepID=UPI00358F3083|nr:hypothetical protein K441DRAFT_71037 [Cenococcum geophilum 1.58]
MEAIIAAVLACSIVFWNFLGYLERKQCWTLRFRLSLWTPYLILLPTSALCLLLLSAGLKVESEDFGGDVESYLLFRGTRTFIVDSLRNASRLVIGLCIIAFLIFLFRVTLPLMESGRYLRLRWKAWTGPSRTGIGPSFSKLIGDEDDWIDLNCAIGLHPIEKFTRVVPSLPGSFSGIVADPTDLLRASVAAVGNGSLVTPRSKFKAGVYQPSSDDESISLLWGEHLGFRRRCSRGIISVPGNLLEYRPTFDSGRDGRAICLAYGILARNKGLEPWNLVCNLNLKSSFRDFEENSVQWPRPAKTLRGVYRAEFERTFSLLGNAYVTAATELALLLADTSDDLVEDWLDGMMEHQDLSLNHHIAALGASGEDLARLYKGQYAIMLVSLSTHKRGIRLRPELLVYDALCQLEDVGNKSRWVSATAIIDRRGQELAQLGKTGQRLISAII